MLTTEIENLMHVFADEDVVIDDATLRSHIFIKGARSNNLKNVDVLIPKNKLVVVTGVSGSGKSSITMDTLFAEGQRRYVESLSSYARQFLMRMKKPDVDYIKGVCPAIAIEQKISSGNNRSTVGSMTEVNDFLHLMYARIGRTISPISGQIVKKQQVEDVVDIILREAEGARLQLFIPLPKQYAERSLSTELNVLLQKGFTRIWFNGALHNIQDVLEGAELLKETILSIENLEKNIGAFAEEDIRILIDRFVIKHDDLTNTQRIADSVQMAFYESYGEAIVEIMGGTTHRFNNRFELDGITFIEPTPQLFNYNNSLGACPVCEGYGKTIGIDEDKVIPNKALSVYEGAVLCWKGEKSSEYQDNFLMHAHANNFPVHTAYQDLTPEQRNLLWKGNKKTAGIDAYFKGIEEHTYKIQNRVILARFRGRTTCPSCHGKRLRIEAQYVKVGGLDIADLMEMPIDELQIFFDNLELNENETTITSRLLLEVKNRLRFMMRVGLGYLTLSRVSNTLSGGETQRINLTRTLGSNLTGSLYILDEPSVGLHPRDTANLVTVLKNLRDLGNTVVVVEHEEEVIRNADYLIDMGPEAGINGGHVVFAGNYADIGSAAPESLTTKYMSGVMQIPVPLHRRIGKNWLTFKGCRQHNLKDITVNVPTAALTVVTGVSGSGKTTLVKQIIYPALLQKVMSSTGDLPGHFGGFNEDVAKGFTAVEFINQSPIGKSSRSNPATYVKAYDDIRDLYSKQTLAKMRNYKPGIFSFNTDGGRCDTCKGEGETVVEMQFLADVHLTCEECDGKRFKFETLEVTFNGKNIWEVLEMDINEALEFFKHEKNIYNKIKPLADVGLGYVKLGQASGSLSGGEAQRVKLASYLVADKNKDSIFFIFDEPTTGLHFHDIRKLLDALNALVDKGHTVLVVEHNIEVIKNADWVIDLGPEGGKTGGNLVYEGTPEGLAQVEESYTGKFLKEKF